MRLMLCLALLCLLFVSAASAEAGGTIVTLSNGQTVILPTNEDYFASSSVFFQSRNSVFVDDFHGSNVTVLGFRRPIIRPRPTITVLPNGTTIIRRPR